MLKCTDYKHHNLQHVMFSIFFRAEKFQKTENYSTEKANFNTEISHNR